MATRILSPENLGPGVRENPHGGYHIHVVLNDVSSLVLGGTTNQDGLAPPDAPVLAGMSVF